MRPNFNGLYLLLHVLRNNIVVLYLYAYCIDSEREVLNSLDMKYDQDLKTLAVIDY